MGKITNKLLVNGYLNRFSQVKIELKTELTDQLPITNDGFWCDVSVEQLVKTYRVPAEYDNDTIYQGLVDAVFILNDKLKTVKAAVMAQGYLSLSEWNADHSQPINGMERTEFYYQKAVFCYAKALLLQQLKMLTRQTAINEEKPDETYRYFLDESEKAVAQLLTLFFPNDLHSGNADFYMAML